MFRFKLLSRKQDLPSKSPSSVRFGGTGALTNTLTNIRKSAGGHSGQGSDSYRSPHNLLTESKRKEIRQRLGGRCEGAASWTWGVVQDFLTWMVQSMTGNKMEFLVRYHELDLPAASGRFQVCTFSKKGACFRR